MEAKRLFNIHIKVSLGVWPPLSMVPMSETIKRCFLELGCHWEKVLLNTKAVLYFLYILASLTTFTFPICKVDRRYWYGCQQSRHNDAERSQKYDNTFFIQVNVTCLTPLDWGWWLEIWHPSDTHQRYHETDRIHGSSATYSPQSVSVSQYMTTVIW